MAIWFILGLLFLILIYSSKLLVENKTKENYIFFGFILLLFVAIYLVSVLNYKISGNTIGLEQQVVKLSENVNKLDDSVTELSGTVSVYTKSITGVDVKEYIKKQMTQNQQ